VIALKGTQQKSQMVVVQHGVDGHFDLANGFGEHISFPDHYDRNKPWSSNALLRLAALAGDFCSPKRLHLSTLLFSWLVCSSDSGFATTCWDGQRPSLCDKKKPPDHFAACNDGPNYGWSSNPVGLGPSCESYGYTVPLVAPHWYAWGNEMHPSTGE
jgi:hypothetical protein